MEIIAIANQKGGVGKTTTAVNLAASLNLKGKRVLLIDIDPQGNATTATGINKAELEVTLADVLLDGVDIKDVIKPSPAGFDILGSNRDMTGTDMTLMGIDNSPMILRESINTLEGYDYIIIDCAPSLNLLTINALVAMDCIIIPMQCEYYALEGLADLAMTIERIGELNPDLYIRGVLRTMYDARSTLTKDVSEELEGHFGDLLYETVIPRNIRLAEAPAHGMTGVQFDEKSKGAQAYLDFADEVIAQSAERNYTSN
ncbi:MAG: cobalamin biosynthesis protein CobQ [Pseudomonadales bacterium]|nr:MAG: cobalamin biosynthesis protein CobQ [Pseudomonadales bacterium]